MRSVCVFCGSRPGNDPAYAAGARRLGRTLAEEGITLVFGGGRVGLMGVVALFDHMVAKGFLSEEHRAAVLV